MNAGLDPAVRPFVSVAICTRNRSTLLRATLEQLTRLVLPQGLAWELLVVDNGSSDNTPAVIADFESRLPVRAIVETAPGLSHARNRAVREAAGEFILWTDDDVIADPAWLWAFVDAVRKYPAADIVGGVVLPWFAVDPDPDYLEGFAYLKNGFCGVDHAAPEGPLDPSLTVVGANMGFRRAPLLEIAFDPRLGFQPGSLIGGEEVAAVEMIRSRGGQLIWCPLMRVRHYVPAERMTLGYILAYYEGRGRESVRLRGVPPGRRLAGVPRWMIRQIVESRVEAWWAKVRGQRVREFKALAVHYQLRGLIAECL